jgi:hypothetical protein
MNTADTLAQMRDTLAKSFAAPIADPRLPDGLAKSTFSQSGSATTGLTFYDLELGAKFLYPVLTPLRNLIARVSGKGGIQANWKAITKINTQGVRIGVSGGNRGAVMAVTTADYNAAYKGIGIESNVDFEAGYAAQGFDDVRAIAAQTGLEALMLGEELVILGGNGASALGVTPTPALAVGHHGRFARRDHDERDLRCADPRRAGERVGFRRHSVAGQQDQRGRFDRHLRWRLGQQVGVGQHGRDDGHDQQGHCHRCGGSGRGGYAWFYGTAGNELLGAITTVNKAVLTATATGTQNASAVIADNSANNLIFDGLLVQATKAGSNAYVKSLDGAPFTATALVASSRSTRPSSISGTSTGCRRTRCGSTARKR